jgi:D-serine deaminase-like pyridoxal phosphate-dependent protein
LARHGIDRATVTGASSSKPLVCDEPGRLGISGATNRLGLGDKRRLVPGHCDPAVNLYDWYDVGIRASRVDALWLITALS